MYIVRLLYAHFIYSVVIVLCLLVAPMGGCTQDKADGNGTPQSRQAAIPMVPTPQQLVETMLDMAKVTSSDYVIDLGSGDGRIVIAAAKRGAMALGIEHDPGLVEFSRRVAIKERVAAKAAFKEADVFESDFSKATVITLFLLPDMLLRLRPKILDMKPGTRVVSNTFTMADWEPDQTTDTLAGRQSEQSMYIWGAPSDWHIVHLWIVPAKVDGIWRLDDGHINFTQNFQYITGTITTGKKETKLTGKLVGDAISFFAGGTQYIGTVSGDTILGIRAGDNAWKATR